MKTSVTKIEMAMPEFVRDADKIETLLTKSEMAMAKLYMTMTKKLNDDQIIAWNEIAVA